MEEKLIGIIGCGLIADTHVEAIKDTVPDASISVCDPLPGKAEVLRKKYGLKSSFTSIEEMLSNENFFSVHILSPPQLHVEHTLQCLEADCHVLVEKPLAFRAKDISELYKAANKHQRVLSVDHSLLYQPSVVKMLDQIRTGIEEHILYINCFYGIDTDETISSIAPKGHWKHGLPGGTLIDSIIHPVTLAVELTGKPNDVNVNLSGSKDIPKDIFITWKGHEAMASITVSTQALPFRRVTEVTTNRRTFLIDHSTETLVSLNSGFGPKSLRKVLKNVGYGTQLILGTLGTVIHVLRGKLKENPGARALIEAYYKNLISGGNMPVSAENVRNSTYALEKIISIMSPPETKKSTEVNKIKEEKTFNLNDEDASKILITGASGFLGNHICKILSDKGKRVIAQVRRGPHADKLQLPLIEKVFEDFDYEPVDFNRLLNNVKYVIHCAHASGAKTWEEFKKTNVDATISLYEEAERAGCEKFIFISSVAVYGVHQRCNISVNENTPAISGNSKWDFYIRSKTMAEKLLLDKAEKGGPRLLIIRPGILYATDGTKLARRSIPLKDSRLVITFGNGRNHSPFTRVDVLAEAIVNAIDINPFYEGIYNMTGNPEESSRDFIYNRMKKFGITCRFMTLPAVPFRLVASLLEFLYSITFRETPPKITRYIIDSSTRNIHYDTAKAEKILGWDSQKAVEI